MHPRPSIKSTADDFVVDELAAYEPEGAGDHLFVRFKKRNRTTQDVVNELARALGIAPRDVGVAGLKDKIGVTTQTISLPRAGHVRGDDLEARVRALAVESVEILDARWHKNKLKTGHLRGNRFTIVVRGVSDVAGALARFDEIRRFGVPNAFGPQRFGIDGRNVERASAWLSGRDRPPRDPKARRFSFSVWQSHVFNRVLAAREREGTWASVLDGDLLVKHGSGGMFVCTDVQTDESRAGAGELSATGPMIGDKMRWPERAARELEEGIVRAALAELGQGADDAREFLRKLAPLGEGTRRPLRQWVEDLSVTTLEGPEQARNLRVQFVLPSGAYATTVLARAIPDIAQIANDSEAQQQSGTEGTTFS